MSGHRLYFHREHGLVEVREGFSWPAFLFGSLWAVARRMYAIFFLMLGVDLVLWFATGYAENQGSSGFALLGGAATLAYAVVRGWYGNRWLESFLTAHGYVLEAAGQ